jgi:hypothetical protein
LLWIRLADSIAPVDENAQQPPQLPWDLIALTFALAVQLTAILTVVLVVLTVVGVACTICRLGGVVPKNIS